MSEPVGIAVVGLGLAGGAMVPVIHAHPGFRLVAAVEPVDEVRVAFVEGEGVPAFANLEHLWELPEVEAVYIATPHQFHRDQTIEAARAGRHVLVEKPMALSVSDCDAMIAECGDADVHLVVGHTHGFDPTVSWIADALRERRFGQLGMIAMWNFTDFLYRPRRPEELDEATGGGIVHNQLPHQIDMLRTVSGAEVRTVRAITSRLDPERPVAGSCTALLELSNGAAATIVYSGYDHFDTDELYDWVAEGGSRKVPDHGAARRRLAAMSAQREAEMRTTTFAYGHRWPVRPPHQPHFGEMVVTCAGGDLRPRPDGVAVYGSDGETLFPVASSVWAGRGDVLEEFHRALTKGDAPVHDGRFGRETVRVCRGIADSAALGREIQMDELRGEQL